MVILFFGFMFIDNNLPDTKSSGQVKKTPGTLFHLHAEVVGISAMEGHMPRLHLWTKNTA